ncbi:uncharacterized protein LOC128893793 [Hylaeus anthracinus]|uniref:uncharacterized protein LOC128893793 n=1 Tax=Hylaeus anthracinus TaxID=313031 RepID=UPI0023B97239|nr:uncharacterized protein LOC128893793 [Hylaeus anthracinus]
MALPETGFVIAPQIPRGLAPAVEGLAREILRHRPQDIYTFAAHHFEQLVKLREKERIAGIISKTSDRLSCNGQDCILWTDRVDPDDSRYHDDRKVINVVEEIAEEPRRTPATTTKLSRRRKEATNRSGWSINETVKVIKRHDCENDARKKKRGNTRMPEKAIKKEVHSIPEQCSPPSSKRMTRCRFLRSSSAGDILAKTITLQHRPPGTNTSEKEPKYVENSGNKNTLKRQKSADQIKRTCSSEVPTEKRHAADPRRSQSLVNVRSKRNGFDAEESWRRVMGNRENSTISRNRLEKKLEERFGSASVRNAEAVLAKLNLRLEKDERESKDNDRVFDDGNAADESLTNRESMETSVVLPSVVRRQSSCRYSRSSSRNDACESVEQNDPTNLILPPISSDASKPIKIENDLTLPSLAKATDAQQNSDILGNPESTNSDHDSVDASVKNECENEHNKGTISFEEDEPEDELDTSDREILKELEVSQSPDPRGGEIDEVFKDSLNVTPDSIEFPQRPDSLERPEEKSSTVVDAERESETLKPELDYPQSNELKKKLLEIETVERNIENTLVSSGRGVTRHDDSTLTSPVVKLSPNSESVASSFVLGNETILPDSSNEKHTEEEEEPAKRDSPKEQSRFVDTRGGDEGVETVSTSPESSRKKSDASETLSVHSPKNIDPSCFILTEGSPCEIPESVTTVIIPDRPPENDDEVLKEMDDVPRSERAISRRVHHETRHEEEEAFQHCADPFGEYISPEYNVDYLRDIKTAVDRANMHHDLGNIKEEEEKDMSDKEITRSIALPEDVTFEESHTSEGIVGTSGSKNGVESLEPVSSSLDQSSGDVESTSPGATTDVQSGPCEANQHEQEEAPGPYVPELNLDSLRDATMSSTEDRSDSRNLENQSEKETDDVTLQEGEKTLSSSDTPSSGKKATLDEDSSRRKSLQDKESSSELEAKTGNGVENCSIEPVDKSDDAIVDEKDGKDSSNIEDEIAKELIQILTLDSPTSQEEETEMAANDSLNNTKRAGDPRIREVGSTAATESVVSTNRSSASSPRGRKVDDVQEENGEKAKIDTDLITELDPCAREITPMVATEAVEVSTNRSSTSSPQEKISQGEDKEVEDVDTKLAMELNPTVYEGDVKEENEGERVDTEEKENVEDNAPSMSAETIDEVTTDINDSSLENPDPPEKIESKGGDPRDAEESIAPDVQTLDAAARRIQYWARKFVVGQGRLTKIDKQSLRDSSSSSTSDNIKKETQVSAASDEHLHESPSGEQKFEEREISDKSKETEDEEQLMNEKETQQIDTSMSASMRHTGEFHDSLPLPLFEVSKSNLSAKDVRALKSMPVNPWFTLEPNAPCFSSQSPRANVFLAFDFSNPFQSVEDKADGSKYYLNFPPCFVHVEHAFDESNANDDASVASLTEKMVDSNIDDVLEPLAIDEPPKSLLIEEIPNDEEEQQPTPTAGTSTSSSSEEQQTNRDEVSADQTVSVDNGPNLRESLSSDSSVIQSDENTRDKTEPGKIESPNTKD